MDGTHFDRIARLLSTRRKAASALLGGGILATVSRVTAMPGAEAAPRGCGRGQKRCGKRCVARRKCCTNANCRSKGTGKVCRNGICRCPRRSPACGRGCCPAGKRCIGQTCWPDAEELAFITLINNHRAATGAPALHLQHQLGAAAELHSQDQARNQFFNHTGSDGSSPVQRIVRAGYAYSAAAENIFWSSNSGSAARAFGAWRDSQGHNANMLNPGFVHLGIGRAQSSKGDWFWTTTFGRPG